MAQQPTLEEIDAYLARHRIDLLDGDLTVPAALAAADGEPAHLRALARTYQRLLRIAPPDGGPVRLADPQHAWAGALVGDGLQSAQQIAAMPEFQFAARYGDAFGGAPAAAAFHARAQARTAQARHLWANLKDTLGSPHYRATRSYNVAPQLAQYYADIPSYQDLFGTLDYIAVPHCDSIFGPAAYFVDLMRIIDLYITLPNQATIPAGFTLAARRPDLFERKLDCQNTLQSLPFLAIVVAVLARRIEAEIHTDPAQAVALAPYPLNLPFNLPLREVRAQLAQLGTTLAQLYARFGAADADVAREQLGMSAETARLLATAAPDPGAVARLYGRDQLDVADLSRVAVFIDATGLTRVGLGELLEQGMTADEFGKLAPGFFINAGETTPPMRVVLDRSDPARPYETIANASAGRLDRLNRFIRLARVLDWSYADLNWAMTRALGAPEIGPALAELAALQRLRQRSGLAADAATALFYQVKNVGRAGLPPADMFDRVFNAPALLTGDPYHSGAGVPFDPAQPLDWTIGGGGAQDSLIRRRLVAALALTDNDLSAVARYAACLVGAKDILKTDLATLSLLYRLARTAQVARVAVGDYLTLLRLMYRLDGDCADRPLGQTTLGPADVAAQLDVVAWGAASGFSAPHLQYVMTGVAEAGFETGYDPVQVRPFVNSLATLSAAARVAPASFAFESLDADRSAQLYQGLVALRVLTPDGIVRGHDTDFAAVARLLQVGSDFVAGPLGADNSAAAYTALVAAKIIADAGALGAAFNAQTSLAFLFPDLPDADYMRDQVRAALLRVRGGIDHALQVLVSFKALQERTAEQGVAQFFATSADMLAVLVPFVAGADDLSEYLPLLLTAVAPDEPVPLNLMRLMAALARGTHLVNMLQLSAAELACIRAHPAAFGLRADALQHPALDEVRSLWSFKQQQLALRDNNGALLAYLGMPDGGGDPKRAKLAALAALTGWEAGQITQLATLYWGEGLQYGTVAGVERLRGSFRVSGATGLAVPSLLQLAALAGLSLGGDAAPATWSAWQGAAKATLAAVKARIDDTEFAAAYRVLSDAGLTAQRDAYVPCLIWLLAKWQKTGFKTAADLYQYLLIDVEMSSCDAVSPIAQGIASLQLYLQRCQLGIDPGVDQLPIPPVWWSWISQYREWEVNRKVFLYPENYIDPTLRHARSPQFAQLQDALLQTEVRDNTVEAAMRGYLDSFATLAGLRIIGAYRAEVTDQGSAAPVDTLFLVGRTSSAPGEYYWRSVAQLGVRQRAPATWTTQGDWGNWQKVGITIPAPFVTPVYAFGKLMLFWVEFEKVSSSIINTKQESENQVFWSAALRYTFMDFGGRWVAAQTAQTSTVVNFKPDNDYLGSANVDPATLSPQQLYWQRVYLLQVPAQRSSFNNGLEQIVLLYGQAFLFFPGQGQMAVPPDSGDPFQQRLDLNLDIYHSMEVVAKLSPPSGQYRGYVMMKGAVSMPASLNAQAMTTVLLNNGPTQLAAGAYAPTVNGAQLMVQDAPNPIYADYYCDYADHVASAGGNLAGAGTAAGNVLLGALAAANRALWTVKNQTGWFIYDNGDDVFLGATQQKSLYRISQIVRATATITAYPPAQYLYTMPFTDEPVPVEQLKFAFSRLGTHTVAALSQRLFTGGIAALLSIPAQQTPELPFARLAPSAAAIDATRNELDFNGAYGPYFWEVFFHSVLLVADRLTDAKRFDEARRWYQYLFDPTAKDGAAAAHDFDRFWRFLPFRGFTQESLTAMLTNVQQIAAYQRAPFDPDAIARLRQSTYPKATVMRYIDNLIKWGDALFAQDTRESITQAVNLYVLADELLGRRPENVRVFHRPVSKSYAELRSLYDNVGLAQGGSAGTIVLAASSSQIDRYYDTLPVQITAGAGAGQTRTIGAYTGATRSATVTAQWDSAPDATSSYRLLSIPTFLIDLENTPALAHTPLVAGGEPAYNDIHAYFGVPENAELIAYWDTVEDRLFKVRHCMNMRGVERPLALFEPALDVRSVLRAAAGGSGLNMERNAAQPIPFYRFETVIERAKELAATVSSLGNALLNALQSADSEALSLLHGTQERAILELTTQLRTDQVNQAIQQQGALQTSRAAALARHEHYQQLLVKDLSYHELLGLQAMSAAAAFNVLGTVTRTAASIGYAVPQFGSPFAMTYGGTQIGNMLNAMSGVFEMGAYLASYTMQRAETMGAYERREQDWTLQAAMADYDTRQIDGQLAAGETSRRIAERELAAHQRSIAENDELEQFLRRKFTNKELYDWIAGRASTVFFQTYTLALDQARAAQSAYQYEMNSADTFVQYDYRDPTYRGLFAGEGLMLSLNQMQWNWLNKRARSLEIEKTISLARLDPQALLALRATGSCRFALSELLFDLDFPGHYCRKIKSISLTLPAVIGPYDNVKATLTQQSNQIVLDNKDVDAVRFLLGENPDSPPGPDQLRSNWWINQQIALSSGANDAGLFELNFNDARYLPFEGTGAVSSWQLSLPKAANRFDFSSLSDVVISLKYTALNGGKDFRDKVTALRPVQTYDGGRLFLLARQFPAAWFAFAQTAPADGKQSVLIDVPAALAPANVEHARLTGVYLQLLADTDAANGKPYLSLQLVALPQPVPVTIAAHNAALVHPSVGAFGGTWTLTFDLASTPETLKKDGALDFTLLKDIALIAYFSGDLQW